MSHENELLKVLAEIMEMAPVRHILGLNHRYESGCHCLRCAADAAIEKANSGAAGGNRQEPPR